MHSGHLVGVASLLLLRWLLFRGAFLLLGLVVFVMEVVVMMVTVEVRVGFGPHLLLAVIVMQK